MIGTMVEIVLAIVVAGGGLFGLIGSWGLLRLPQSMQRLHAPTKATTLGVGAALIASNSEMWTLTGRFAWQEILISVFLFITAPLSALMLSKVHIARNLDRGSLPRPAGGGHWATEAPNALQRDPAAPPRGDA
jgi:multicomponent K+:H+ antiporter subunit G